ncbi:carbohydrate kinase family protein [Paenibacillus psychroresistens]|nr:carbohydrate kinase [Paenibacillus psychroresistens]
MDAVAVGELLIDFVPNGISDNGNVLFERNPGGAPANVLAMLAKLGLHTAFIGKIGNDPFGRFLEETLQLSKINTSGLVFDNDVNTTLAFVHLQENGERSFSFYRKPGADLMLTVEEINVQLIESARLFHFGSVSMTGEPARSATLYAAKHAKQQGKLVSYDPNLRESLWSSLEEAKEIMLQGLVYTDILKVSQEELQFLTGEADLGIASGWIAETYGIELIFVTQGSEGCYYRFHQQVGHVPAFQVNAVDTTGAGDAFFGSILYRILAASTETSLWTVAEIEAAIRFSNAAGALTTLKKGAIPALPILENIVEKLSEVVL